MKGKTNCETCGKEFKRRSPTQRYCSEDCKTKAISRTCLCCGKIFYQRNIKKSHSGNNLLCKKFCSHKCYLKHIQETNYLIRADRRELSCGYCRKKFVDRESQIGNFNNNFCSRKCFHKYTIATSRICVMCDECNEWFEMKIKLYNNLKDNKKRILCKKCNYKRFKASILEKSFYREFLDSSPSFKRQSYLINKYVVDFVNHDNKIIIEILGDYWHCNPKIFKEDCLVKQKNMSAKQIWEADKQRSRDLEKEGYKVIFIWGDDINNNKTKVNNILSKNRVLDILFK